MVNEPAVATIVKEYGPPTAAELETPIVRVDVADPPLDTKTGFELKSSRVTHEGLPEFHTRPNETDPLNAFREVTVTVDGTEFPCMTPSADGLAPMSKVAVRRK